jgi:4-hydroxy-3-methylbut-2-enyl diphosphate reductase IspH
MGSVENIVIAKRTGVCYGVREAIDKAKIARASGKETHTLGHVVHNEGLIADLRAVESRMLTNLMRSRRGPPSLFARMV